MSLKQLVAVALRLGGILLAVDSATIVLTYLAAFTGDIQNAALVVLLPMLMLNLMVLALALLAVFTPMRLASLALRGIATDDADTSAISERGLMAVGLVLLGLYLVIIGLGGLNSVISAIEAVRTGAWSVKQLMSNTIPAVLPLVAGLAMIIGGDRLGHWFLKLRGRA